MARKMKRISKKLGMKPGSIVYVGEHRTDQAVIDIIDFGKREYEERRVERVEDCYPYKDKATVTWINITGIHDVEIISKLGEHFSIHPLILEDIANAGQRPKLEEVEGNTFVVLKMLYMGKELNEILSEQVSLIFGSNSVITFQEREGDVFNYVRERIRKTEPRIRFLGPDYLVYSLMDAIVDHYFLVLERLGDQIQGIEDELVSRPGPEHLQDIFALKRELLYLRKSVWPLREVVGGLERSDSPLIHDFTRPYLRDLYEHTIQVIDTVETFRDTASGLLDIHLSSVSNKMNEVMKVLTIIATVFIPLGFLAGVYGMNFDTEASPFNMPELKTRFGYLFFWLAALLIAGGLFAFFRRKRWI